MIESVQVVKNVSVALSVLRNPDMTGLLKSALFPISSGLRGSQSSEDEVMYCSAEDLVSGKVSVWEVLSRVLAASGAARGRPASRRASSAEREARQPRGNRSRSNSRGGRSRSSSPVDERREGSDRAAAGGAIEQQQQRSKGYEGNASREAQRRPPSPATSRREEAVRGASSAPAAATGSVSALRRTAEQEPPPQQQQQQSKAPSERHSSVPASAAAAFSSSREGRVGAVLQAAGVDLQPRTSGAQKRYLSMVRERESFVQPEWNDTTTPAKSTRGLRSDIIGLTPALLRELAKSRKLALPEGSPSGETRARSSSASRRERPPGLTAPVWGAARPVVAAAAAAADLRNDVQKKGKSPRVAASSGGTSDAGMMDAGLVQPPAASGPRRVKESSIGSSALNAQVSSPPGAGTRNHLKLTVCVLIMLRLRKTIHCPLLPLSSRKACGAFTAFGGLS